MKLLTIILIAVIAIGGTVIGLGYAGVMKIPGITPEKKKPAATADPANTNTESKETTDANQSAPNSGAQPAAEPLTKPPVAPPVEEQPAEPVQRKDGTERLAKLWSTMDADAVKKILVKWEDGDALPVLAKMDDSKLAELISAIAADDADRAAKISKGIKALEKGGK